MRILMTGGAGYIGSHTLVALLSDNHEICVVDDFSNSDRRSIQRVKSLAGKSFRVCEINLCDLESLLSIFDDFKPSSVIHFAGLKAVGESTLLPIKYYRNNLLGSLNLLEAMSLFGCKNIIFSSSANVYVQQGKAVDEQQPIGPKNPYGRSKYFIEEMIRDWVFADKTKSAVLLRYFNPVGAHKSGEIGECPSKPPTNLFPIIGQVSIGARECLDVFGHDYDTHDGTAIRDYIHVLDLAQGHVAGLNYLSKSSGVEIFNLGTGTGYSVLDVIKSYGEICGKNIPYKLTPRRLGDVSVLISNSEKARRLLDWAPKFGLKEMCEDAWRWKTKNPTGFRS